QHRPAVLTPRDSQPELGREPVEQRADGFCVWELVCGYRGPDPPRGSRPFLRPRSLILIPTACAGDAALSALSAWLAPGALTRTHRRTRKEAEWNNGRIDTHRSSRPT